MPLSLAFARFSSFVARLAGRLLAFSAAPAFVVGWPVAGPIFHFSDTW